MYGTVYVPGYTVKNAVLVPDAAIGTDLVSRYVLVVGDDNRIKYNVVPPSFVVRTSYPGASPEILMDTVVAPLEQEINGVENMLYMASQCSSDGSILITITFEVGTNLDIAQVQVQNRVAIATPRLPEEVRNIGVVVKKRSPDM